MSRARLAVLVLCAGALGSQAGHLFAYQLRFGAAAQQLQSSGAHAYWPAFVKTAFGVAALAVLVSLLIVGAARLAAGRRIEPGSAPPFVSLLAAVYTLQLACFAGQEIAEAIAAGTDPMPVVALLLWGAVGQLPAAFISALAVRWLLARVRPAMEALRLAPSPRWVAPVFAIRSWSGAPDPAVALETLDGSYVRGPPPSF